MVVLFVGLALGKTGPGMRDFLQVATPAGPFYKGSNRYGSVGFAKPPGPYEIGGGEVYRTTGTVYKMGG